MGVAVRQAPRRGQQLLGIGSSSGMSAFEVETLHVLPDAIAKSGRSPMEAVFVGPCDGTSARMDVRLRFIAAA